MLKGLFFLIGEQCSPIQNSTRFSFVKRTTKDLDWKNDVLYRRTRTTDPTDRRAPSPDTFGWLRPAKPRKGVRGRPPLVLWSSSCSEASSAGASQKRGGLWRRTSFSLQRRPSAETGFGGRSPPEVFGAVDWLFRGRKFAAPNFQSNRRLFVINEVL